MLTINKTKEKEELCLALEGRLDTVTAPQLEKELQGSLADVKAQTLTANAGGSITTGVYLLRRTARTARRPEDHESAGRDEARPCERDSQGDL